MRYRSNIRFVGRYVQLWAVRDDISIAAFDSVTISVKRGSFVMRTVVQPNSAT
jgi:hypothetical protein